MSVVKIRAALEIALAAIPGIIPEVNIVASINGEFETQTDHGLQAGLHVTISNHIGTGAANGTYRIADVFSDRTFTLEDIVTGLQVDSNGTTGSVLADLFAWENMDFPNTANRVPYHKVNLIPGRPEDVTVGNGYRREYGIFQVTLVYPLQIGTGEASERAELIKSTFPRGASFSNGGVVVKIDATPEIMRGYPTDDSYMIPVRVYYYADIFNS
jgi:hypothetical protein